MSTGFATGVVQALLSCAITFVQAEVERTKMILFTALTTLFALFLIPYFVYSIFFLIQGKNENVINEHSKKYEPTISVITATYNEEDKICKKLENTFQLDYPVDRMEIIVVDSSTDNTPNLVKKWLSTHPNIRLITEDRRRGLASALNLGYSQARGEIVIKSDCDIILQKDSLRCLVSNFADKNVGAVAGKQLLVGQSKHEAGYRSLMDSKRLLENQIDSVYLLEPFVAFRKDLIEPIDEKSVADDAELGVKIRKKGYRVLFDPTACFYEHVPSKTSNRLQMKQRRAQGHIRLMLSNLDVLFNIKYGKYGTLIFPLNFHLIVIAPWILFLISWVFPVFMYAEYGDLGVMAVALLYSLIIVSYASGYPKLFTGFIESQLALVLGGLNLALKGPAYMWTKNRGP